MNLTSFRVHHYGDRVPLLLVEPPDTLDDAAVPLARTMAHVDPRHVHPADGQRLQLLRPTRRRADGAHELRAPRAPEPILLQLDLRHRIHLDGRHVAGGRGRRVPSGGRRNRSSDPIVGHQDVRSRRGLRVGVGGRRFDGEIGEDDGRGANGGGKGRLGVGFA